MDYITAREAAGKWGVSGRSINYYLTAGRIPGAVKKGMLWLIPANAQRPADKRRRGSPLPGQARPLSDDLYAIIAATSVLMPDHNPDGILDIACGEGARIYYEAEIAYLRGDFARAMGCFYRTEGDETARLHVSTIAVGAAISMGDYQAYMQVENYLNRCVKNSSDSVVAAMAELALSTAAVSCLAANMASEWLKEGDLSPVPVQMRAFALYLRAKYLQCTGRYEAMLSVAQTALALSEPERGISPAILYLRLCCAMACHALGQEEDARRHLLTAMRIALPHGFISPFAEAVTVLGGHVERCLEQEFPDHYDAVLVQWKRIFSNWVTFHNQFTKDNITDILTLREYHIAVLISRRVPYARVAEQHCVSVGRLKNIIQDIYGKLFITSRNELARYVL